MRSLPRLLISMMHKLWNAIDLNLLCFRHKDVYLRKRGARIGTQCDLITNVVNFGTEPYLVRIGNQVTVTSGVKFITHDASTRLFRDRFPNMSRYGNVFAPILIGDNCFIGVNTILLPGTTIGSNSIVGAGAVVKGVFPDSSVIAGVPARRLFSLDAYIEKVQKNMISLHACDRSSLKNELMSHFFEDN